MTFTILAAVVVLALMASVTSLGARAIERRFPAHGRFIEVPGGKLHVLELDPPPQMRSEMPVVLLHGASGNLQDMRMALARLARHRRVILFDRPGHGWSERPGGRADASPTRQAELVQAALARIGVGRAVMVGYSWSGALALAYALRFPEQVAGLVLLAPVTHPWPGGVAWYYRAANLPGLGEVFARTLVLPIGSLVAKPLARGVFKPQPMPENYLNSASINLLFRPATFRANARDVVELRKHVAEQSRRYHHITAPTVIITGDRDASVSPNIHARPTAEAIPHAKLIVLAGVGHAVHHVAADLIADEIETLAAGDRVARV